MTGGVWATAWAVARAGWLASYNRSWRFARWRTVPFWLAAQLVLIWFIGRRAPVAAGALPLQGILPLVALQMAWFGLFQGYTFGQFQLYTGALVPLFLASPAPPLGFVLGRTLERLPARAWSALLWAWAYSRALPPGLRPAGFALIWTVAFAAGSLGYLTGLLTLSAVGRAWPRGLQAGAFAGLVVNLALATWAAVFLAQGGTVTDLALRVRAWRGLVYGVGGGLLALPGLGLLLAFLLRPQQAERLYLTGVYRVLEDAEREAARPRRSRWLPLPPGPLRGLLSKEWLVESRSVATRIRLLIWLFGTAGVWVAGRAVAGQGVERAVLYVGSLTLLAWGLSFSGSVAIAFSTERVTQMLYRLAAVPAGAVLAGKFLALWLPSLVLVAASTLVGAAAAHLGAGETLQVLGWSLLAVTASVVAGLGVGAATAGEEPDEPETLLGPRAPLGGGRGGGGGPWALARTLALVVPVALVMWAGAGQPWLPVRLPRPLVLAACVLVPATCAAAGYRLMAAGWRCPRPRRRARG